MENSQEYHKETIIGNHSGPITSAQSTQINKQMKESLCKIHMNNGHLGSGFFCKIPFPDEFNLLPVLFTNNHVLEEKDIQNDMVILFTLEDDKIQNMITIDNTRKKYTSVELDTTIIEIKKEDGIKSFLDIDEQLFKLSEEEIEKNYKGKEIYVIQYPKGKKMSFSDGILKGIDENEIYHFCSTKEGSSGGAIISLSDFKVIGIHKGWRNKNNLGTLINAPIKEFIKKYKNEINNNIYINNYNNKKN